MGQPFLGLILVAFVCQLEEITWIQKLGKSEVLIGTKTEGDSWPLRSCPGVSQGYRQEQLHMTACALVRKQPRSNRRKDLMPPDSEISEKQLDRLGEPCCLQPGVGWGESEDRPQPGPLSPKDSQDRKGSIHSVADDQGWDKVRLWDGLVSLGVWKDGLKVALADCAVFLVVGKHLNRAPVRGLTLAVNPEGTLQNCLEPHPRPIG